MDNKNSSEEIRLASLGCVSIELLALSESALFGARFPCVGEIFNEGFNIVKLS
jgi:hypothetical protein